MSLATSLRQITASGFEKMPHSIAKVINDGIKELRIDGLAERTLSIGDTVPDGLLTIPTSGKREKWSSFLEQDFLVLNFYRGGWCPYCNLELRAYEQLKTSFAQAAASVISISAELPAYASTTSARNRLSHPVLTDMNGALAKNLGIYFELNEDLLREYASFGINLSELHGNDEQGLLVPAVFVVDRAGTIVWKHVEPDYMTRAEPVDVLEGIRKLSKRIPA